MTITITKTKAYALTDGEFRDYQIHPIDPSKGFKGGFVIDELDRLKGGRVGRVHIEARLAETLSFVFRDIAELDT